MPDAKSIHDTQISLPLPSLAVIAASIVIDIVFLALFSAQVKSVTLLKNEAAMLRAGNEATSVTATEMQEYAEQEGVLEKVFPNEETIPAFIQDLETQIRAVSSEYSFRFSSLTPIPEQDKVYLLLTITMRTDFPKLQQFLGSLERLPYMTHVVNIQMKSDKDFAGEGEAHIGLKVYVQNPFSTK